MECKRQEKATMLTVALEKSHLLKPHPLPWFRSIAFREIYSTRSMGGAYLEKCEIRKDIFVIFTRILLAILSHFFLVTSEVLARLAFDQSHRKSILSKQTTLMIPGKTKGW